ncbi:hypothetical protein CHS0354_009306 [Potamilus streckersoni]|uniref:Invertebrate defensins family profile domain-containing protein n=1 Tax=Potamilus streckersoni TaxID=2493646 RepID=A0AAE0SMW3_9BIVA|nr:hypothetical protein CHS0354_009306 [Potamilus streckersoni]
MMGRVLFVLLVLALTMNVKVVQADGFGHGCPLNEAGCGNHCIFEVGCQGGYCTGYLLWFWCTCTYCGYHSPDVTNIAGISTDSGPSMVTTTIAVSDTPTQQPPSNGTAVESDTSTAQPDTGYTV